MDSCQSLFCAFWFVFNTGTPSSICGHRYVCVSMHSYVCMYVLHYWLHSFFTKQSELCQLVLLATHNTMYSPQNHQREFWSALYHRYYISKELLAIGMPHLPLVFTCTYSNTLLLLLIMSAFNSTDEHVGLITFLNYELSGGRWRNLENEIHRKIILNEYSDCTHYEAKRCRCKENSTSCSLLLMIFLLVN